MKKLTPLFLSLCFLFSFNQAKATHLFGAEMQWKCMGNDTFEIKIVIYRRCTDGAVALSIYPPTVTSDSCTNAYTVTVGSLIEHLVDDITPVCSTQPKLCPSAGGTGQSTAQIPFGVERHILRYKLYLGGVYTNCCWYKLQWEQQARNSNITTGYADQNFLIESWLNRCVSPCDNGPEFKNPPLLLKCAGQDVFYNNGVSDADDDSLSYALTLPLGGGSYTSPWSYNYPLTCFGGNNPNPTANPPTGFNLNPVTGNISFRPMQVQISVLKVMVTEWRKDTTGVYKIIGKTARDMQMAIMQNCNNKLPALSGPFSYESCSDQQLCININTSDQDIIDTSRVFWTNGQLPGATWSTNNGAVKNATGTLCWTPADSNASTLPYYVTVTVADDHCPLSGTVTRLYEITVKPSPKNTRTFTKINCSLLEFAATPTSSYFNGAAYKWYVPKLVGTGSPTTIYDVKAVTQYQFTQGGKYLLRSTMFFNGCTTTYFDTLDIDSNIILNITAQNSTKLCPGDTAILIADSALNYQWYKDSLAINGATSRIYLAKKEGKYSVRNNKTGCFYTSNIIIVTEIEKTVISRPASMCSGNVVTYKASGIAGSTYQWYRNGTLISGANTDSLAATQDGVYYCIVSNTKCIVQTISDTLTFLPTPVKPTITKTGSVLTSTPGFSYQWYFNNSPITGATSIFYVATVSGSYKVKVTGVNGCFIFSDSIYFINVGIKTKVFAAKIKISPNPFHDQLLIEIKDSENPVLVSLYDMQGKMILQQKVNAKEVALLNTASLSDGMYLLQVNDGENKSIYKVEKQ